MHNGKVPKKGHEQLKVRRQIDELREKLKIAINEEDFEQAAVLRDQIRALEAEETKAEAKNDNDGKKEE